MILNLKLISMQEHDGVKTLFYSCMYKHCETYRKENENTLINL
jgi:hypothetical protein